MNGPEIAVIWLRALQGIVVFLRMFRQHLWRRLSTDPSISVEILRERNAHFNFFVSTIHLLSACFFFLCFYVLLLVNLLIMVNYLLHGCFFLQLTMILLGLPTRLCTLGYICGELWGQVRSLRFETKSFCTYRSLKFSWRFFMLVGYCDSSFVSYLR